ncbi:biliverdin-producing heme oxygenase [Pseudomonas turukhanskensis]|uniref:Heme oxygenase n=1 Tax=Pseudomonas turukhanskensis TaxID=1806536 RepID=A0A9W6K8Z7_9PSED|nr:biliverdin-producing heme oxygenase [Pseudomonas turukhanskensis]GLK90284.1 heme oxygenase [Pseudomonas turukhanskensis]
MDSLRARLRRMGADLHQQVDDAYSQLGLETAEGYRHFLQAHAAALFSLEPCLEQSGVAELLEDWPERRRSEALRADLQAMNCEPCTSLAMAPNASAAWCWGALYVLEGSRLGGKLLARQLQAAQPGAPMRYLDHAADQSLWPRFLQRLESQAQGSDEGELKRGVEEAFGVFIRAAQGQMAGVV